MATQKIFQVILKIWPKNFLFFFQPQIEFRTQTNIFRKKIFCMQKLIFLFLLYGVLMYALINVW